MSESQGGAGRREVAFRLFAAEYDDADLSYSESDEERAPNYVVTPTGARVNRLFVVGVLTEVENVSDDYLRARVVDPTGPFVVYAGQYQPEAMNFLERAEPPLFVAVTGKARTFQPEDSDRVYTSIRPESINEVDAETRDRWVVQAAEQTVDRVTRAAEAKLTGLEGERLTAALSAHGVDDGLASGIPLALSHYGTTGEYLAAVRELALDAARVVAGERDEVAPFSVAPGEGTDEPLETLAERPIDVEEFEDDEGAAERAEPDLSEAPEPDDEPSPTDEEIDEVVESAEVGGADAEPETAKSDERETGTAETGASAETAETASAETTETTSAEKTETAPAETGSPDAVEEEADAPATTADETEGDELESAADDDASVAEASTSDDEAASEDAADDEIRSEDAADGETEPEDADDLEEFDGEFELDEDERAEIEEEYGTEFQSGSEVSEPGEADIETPTTEPPAEPGEADALDEADEKVDTGSDEESDESIDAETEDAADADEGDEAVDEDDEVETTGEIALDDAVMDAMADLDDGDGADRDAVIAEVVEATGADPGDVEDAIQEALMDGRCYEPNDETLKAI